MYFKSLDLLCKVGIGFYKTTAYLKAIMKEVKGMKRTKIILLIISFVLIIIIGALLLFNDNHNSLLSISNVNRTYLLQDMDKSTKDNYVLVRFHYDSVKTHDFMQEAVTDSKLLYENKNVFCIRNHKEAYGTTCEGFFDLYKNGKLIGKEIYDPNMEVTEQIDYGTLENAFRVITKEQLDELLITSK